MTEIVEDIKIVEVEVNRPPAAKAHWREIADFMCLWRLCDRAACRRACACRGEPRACFARLSPLTPRPAREFVVGMFALKEQGVPFERAMWDLADGLYEFKRWIGALDTATGRPPAGKPGPEKSRSDPP